MLFWGLPELPHSLNTLLCRRLQGVKSPGRLGTRADAFSLQLLVLHCIQNKSDSQLVCVGIITQVQLGKPTKGETRPAEDFKTSRLGIWRHSLTIMLWHAVTLHKLAEGVTFRRCVLFSPTWTHVEVYLISSTRNICRNGWRTAVYFGLRPQTRCLKACWETPPTYPQRAAVQKPYHNFPFPSFTLRSLSFNYSNKYIPNIQYVTLKYMK